MIQNAKQTIPSRSSKRSNAIAAAAAAAAAAATTTTTAADANVPLDSKITDNVDSSTTTNTADVLLDDINARDSILIAVAKVLLVAGNRPLDGPTILGEAVRLALVPDDLCFVPDPQLVLNTAPQTTRTVITPFVLARHVAQHRERARAAGRAPLIFYYSQAVDQIAVASSSSSSSSLSSTHQSTENKPSSTTATTTNVQHSPSTRRTQSSRSSSSSSQQQLIVASRSRHTRSRSPLVEEPLSPESVHVSPDGDELTPSISLCDPMAIDNEENAIETDNQNQPHVAGSDILYRLNLNPTQQTHLASIFSELELRFQLQSSRSIKEHAARFDNVNQVAYDDVTTTTNNQDEAVQYTHQQENDDEHDGDDHDDEDDSSPEATRRSGRRRGNATRSTSQSTTPKRRRRTSSGSLSAASAEDKRRRLTRVFDEPNDSDSLDELSSNPYTASVSEPGSSIISSTTTYTTTLHAHPRGPRGAYPPILLGAVNEKMIHPLSYRSITGELFELLECHYLPGKFPPLAKFAQSPKMDLTMLPVIVTASTSDVDFESNSRTMLTGMINVMPLLYIVAVKSAGPTVKVSTKTTKGPIAVLNLLQQKLGLLIKEKLKKFEDSSPKPKKKTETMEMKEEDETEETGSIDPTTSLSLATCREINDCVTAILYLLTCNKRGVFGISLPSRIETRTKSGKLRKRAKLPPPKLAALLTTNDHEQLSTVPKQCSGVWIDHSHAQLIANLFDVADIIQPFLDYKQISLAKVASIVSPKLPERRTLIVSPLLSSRGEIDGLVNLSKNNDNGVIMDLRLPSMMEENQPGQLSPLNVVANPLGMSINSISRASKKSPDNRIRVTEFRPEEFLDLASLGPDSSKSSAHSRPNPNGMTSGDGSNKRNTRKPSFSVHNSDFTNVDTKTEPLPNSLQVTKLKVFSPTEFNDKHCVNDINVVYVDRPGTEKDDEVEDNEASLTSEADTQSEKMDTEGQKPVEDETIVKITGSSSSTSSSSSSLAGTHTENAMPRMYLAIVDGVLCYLTWVSHKSGIHPTEIRFKGKSEAKKDDKMDDQVDDENVDDGGDIKSVGSHMKDDGNRCDIDSAEVIVDTNNTTKGRSFPVDISEITPVASGTTTPAVTRSPTHQDLALLDVDSLNVKQADSKLLPPQTDEDGIPQYSTSVLISALTELLTSKAGKSELLAQLSAPTTLRALTNAIANPNKDGILKSLADSKVTGFRALLEYVEDFVQRNKHRIDSNGNLIKKTSQPSSNSASPTKTTASHSLILLKTMKATEKEPSLSSLVIPCSEPTCKKKHTIEIPTAELAESLKKYSNDGSNEYSAVPVTPNVLAALQRFIARNDRCTANMQNQGDNLGNGSGLRKTSASSTESGRSSASKQSLQHGVGNQTHRHRQGSMTSPTSDLSEFTRPSFVDLGDTSVFDVNGLGLSSAASSSIFFPDILSSITGLPNVAVEEKPMNAESNGFTKLAGLELCDGLIPQMRRVDNDMVNATLLLHFGGVYTDQERSIILSLERTKVRYKDKENGLFGTWIPLSRAKEIARSMCIESALSCFLRDDLSDEIFEKVLGLSVNDDRERIKSEPKTSLFSDSNMLSSSSSGMFYSPLLNPGFSLLPDLSTGLSMMTPVDGMNSPMSIPGSPTKTTESREKSDKKKVPFHLRSITDSSVTTPTENSGGLLFSPTAPPYQSFVPPSPTTLSPSTTTSVKPVVGGLHPRWSNTPPVSFSSYLSGSVPTTSGFSMKYMMQQQGNRNVGHVHPLATRSSMLYPQHGHANNHPLFSTKHTHGFHFDPSISIGSMSTIAPTSKLSDVESASSNAKDPKQVSSQNGRHISPRSAARNGAGSGSDSMDSLKATDVIQATVTVNSIAELLQRLMEHLKKQQQRQQKSKGIGIMERAPQDTSSNGSDKKVSMMQVDSDGKPMESPTSPSSKIMDETVKFTASAALLPPRLKPLAASLASALIHATTDMSTSELVDFIKGKLQVMQQQQQKNNESADSKHASADNSQFLLQSNAIKDILLSFLKHKNDKAYRAMQEEGYTIVEENDEAGNSTDDTAIPSLSTNGNPIVNEENAFVDHSTEKGKQQETATENKNDATSSFLFNQSKPDESPLDQVIPGMSNSTAMIATQAALAALRKLPGDTVANASTLASALAHLNSSLKSKLGSTSAAEKLVAAAVVGVMKQQRYKQQQQMQLQRQPSDKLKAKGSVKSALKSNKNSKAKPKTGLVGVNLFGNNGTETGGSFSSFGPSVVVDSQNKSTAPGSKLLADSGNEIPSLKTVADEHGNSEFLTLPTQRRKPIMEGVAPGKQTSRPRVGSDLRRRAAAAVQNARAQTLSDNDSFEEDEEYHNFVNRGSTGDISPRRFAAYNNNNDLSDDASESTSTSGNLLSDQGMYTFLDQRSRDEVSDKGSTSPRPPRNSSRRRDVATENFKASDLPSDVEDFTRKEVESESVLKAMNKKANANASTSGSKTKQNVLQSSTASKSSSSGSKKNGVQQAKKAVAIPAVEVIDMEADENITATSQITLRKSPRRSPRRSGEIDEEDIEIDILDGDGDDFR